MALKENDGAESDLCNDWIKINLSSLNFLALLSVIRLDDADQTTGNGSAVSCPV